MQPRAPAGSRDAPEALPSSATVNGLLEQEIIELDGDRHIVAVPLFADWIRANHPT